MFNKDSGLKFCYDNVTSCRKRLAIVRIRSSCAGANIGTFISEMGDELNGIRE